MLGKLNFLKHYRWFVSITDYHTVCNTPNFVVMKFWVNRQFPQIFGRIAQKKTGWSWIPTKYSQLLNVGWTTIPHISTTILLFRLYGTYDVIIMWFVVAKLTDIFLFRRMLDMYFVYSTTVDVVNHIHDFLWLAILTWFLERASRDFELIPHQRGLVARDDK